jgi:endoglucanase
MPAISRTLFSIAIVCSTLMLTLTARAEKLPSWERYKALFVAGDGRVIDYGQGQVTTSEGQGYGMLLSVHNDDRKAFDRIWTWSRSNLGVRKDSLMAWLWGKRPNEAWDIMDYNNATDGDILVALALVKAADKWHHEQYKQEATLIIRSIREKLAVRQRERTYLLPGYYGFTDKDSVTLNPSYLIFPAYRLFAEIDDKHFWYSLHRDSLDLLKRSSFGEGRLPADWVMLTGDDIGINEQRSTRFGYDAVRVFLHLSWEKEKMHGGLAHVLEIYRKKGYIPRWVDLKDGGISRKSAHAGIYAIYGLAARRAGDLKISQEIMNEAITRLQDEDREYYSYSLFLLSMIEDIT